MQRFHAKDPEKLKLDTRRAIRQGPDSEYNIYGEYDSCKEYSTYREYSTYSKYSMYSKYNKYNKTYDKVATADYQAPTPKGGSKGGTERYHKDTLSWFSPQEFFTGFIKAL